MGPRKIEENEKQKKIEKSSNKVETNESVISFCSERSGVFWMMLRGEKSKPLVKWKKSQLSHPRLWNICQRRWDNDVRTFINLRHKVRETWRWSGPIRWKRVGEQQQKCNRKNVSFSHCQSLVTCRAVRKKNKKIRGDRDKVHSGKRAYAVCSISVTVYKGWMNGSSFFLLFTIFLFTNQISRGAHLAGNTFRERKCLLQFKGKN